MQSIQFSRLSHSQNSPIKAYDQNGPLLEYCQLSLTLTLNEYRGNVLSLVSQKRIVQQGLNAESCLHQFLDCQGSEIEVGSTWLY